MTIYSNFNPFLGGRTKREVIIETGVGKFTLPKGTQVRPSAAEGETGGASNLYDAYPSQSAFFKVRIDADDIEPFKAALGQT